MPTPSKSKKILLLIFISTFMLFALRSFGVVGSALASNCPASDYDCQISEIQREIDALSGAHETNKKELGGLEDQLSSLSSRIKGISSDLSSLEIEIQVREDELAYTEDVFVQKTSEHYKFIRTYDPLAPFLASQSASEAFIEISLKQAAAKNNRETIEKYADDLLKLKNDRNDLENNKSTLAAVQAQVNERAEFLTGEVNKVESYLTELSSRQQELAALKAGGFQTSIGDTPPTLEPCSGPAGTTNFCDPGFRPAFGGFSFGAPHRTGMSQFGAYGRSKSGQSAETILSAYYQGASLNKNYPSPATIGVTGIGRVSFEENYLLGIYEVPESWGDKGGFEALKAQAVAARSFALAATDNGAGNICTSESCQVYKSQLKSGKWAEAVRATRGWVIEVGGQPAKTYYSSTTGGYTISQWGWSGIKDAPGNWPDTAYEKLGGSPWFYKGWYKSRGGSSCGRSHPWLTSEELADIVNAWHVLYKGGGDTSRISPIDVSCWQGNPYSNGELVSIGGYTSISSVSVVYANSGSTQSVTLGTNKGSINIDATEFKKAFNLRAPGYIGLKSSLFNIEKL